MKGREAVDAIGGYLARDEEVPDEVVTALLAAIPRRERERWLVLLAELAWRPAALEPENAERDS